MVEIELRGALVIKANVALAMFGNTQPEKREKRVALKAHVRVLDAFSWLGRSRVRPAPSFGDPSIRGFDLPRISHHLINLPHVGSCSLRQRDAFATCPDRGLSC